jgi:hypothetical protein
MRGQEKYVAVTLIKQKASMQPAFTCATLAHPPSPQLPNVSAQHHHNTGHYFVAFKADIELEMSSMPKMRHRP